MQPDDIETTGQIDALRTFASSAELAQLREQTAAAKSAPDELDFLDLLGVFWQENVHSNFLGWLLNPAASHGVGDYFLKKFLLATAAQSSNQADCMAKRLREIASKIEKANWSKAKVHLEWHAVVNGDSGYLDILTVNPEPPILCAIENKVFSPESVGQLSHYRKALENDYPNFTRHLVFLSPDGRRSQEDTEKDVWTPANYTTVRRLIEKTLADNTHSISEDVRVFLRQYATTLRRKIVPEATEIQQLVRKIYLENRDVIDLICRHKPDLVGEMKQVLRDAVAQQEGWVLDREDPLFIRFKVAEWAQFRALETGTGWLPRSSALLLFQFNFRDGYSNLPYLDLGLSPGSDELVRKNLFASAQQHPNLFTTRERNLPANWSVLDAKESILDEADLDNWDDPSVRAKIMAWVADFAENRFPKMNEVIINCLREYEAGQSLPPAQ